MMSPFRRYAAERSVVAAFRHGGAVGVRAARSLDDLRLRPSDALGALLDRGIVRENDTGRYYLFEPVASARHTNIRRALVIVLVLLVMLGGPALLLHILK